MKCKCTEWDWSFGEGASPASASTAGPHNVSYATPGLKTVLLTINGSLTETKENYIEVFTNPVGWILNFQEWTLRLIL